MSTETHGADAIFDVQGVQVIISRKTGTVATADKRARMPRMPLDLLMVFLRDTNKEYPLSALLTISYPDPGIRRKRDDSNVWNMIGVINRAIGPHLKIQRQTRGGDLVLRRQTLESEVPLVDGA